MHYIYVTLSQHKYDPCVENLISELKTLYNVELFWPSNRSLIANPLTIKCSINVPKSSRLEKIIHLNKNLLDICELLTDYILAKHEPLLISRLIKCRFNSIPSTEKKQIFQYVLNELEKTNNVLSYTSSPYKKDFISKKLLDYFRASDSIILEGFVNFRLKDYVAALDSSVSNAIDSFIEDKEYKEFISLLKYFVSTQKPIYKAIHIVENFDGNYTLLNEHMHIITSEYLDDLLKGYPQCMSPTDAIIGALIAIAPLEIIIHGIGIRRNTEPIKTIMNIFLKRVTICNGCEICSGQLGKEDLFTTYT